MGSVINEAEPVVRRIGACSSRTGADTDRRQRASFSRHRAVRTNNMECMCQHCSAAACGSSCRSCKTKVHLSLQRKELFSRGFHSSTTAGRGRATGKVPRACAGECASELLGGWLCAHAVSPHLRCRASRPRAPRRFDTRRHSRARAHALSVSRSAGVGLHLERHPGVASQSD